ncbi:hypothetical protein [Nocardia altamirensis]|uniref:hypothetical protein n=1 Tax=Nocardia altamirensis TaxID=472158 RepID=UPI00114CE014|nr:hypothetical protein [Nocardia altamirensis]
MTTSAPAEHCHRCDRPITPPAATAAGHATSEGVVRYTRCGCGNPQIWLTPVEFDAARLLHR